MKGFLSKDVLYTLDVLGRRYGERPSEVLGYHPNDGRGLLLDISCMTEGMEREKQPETARDKYMNKKRGWNQEVYKDVTGSVI